MKPTLYCSKCQYHFLEHSITEQYQQQIVSYCPICIKVLKINGENFEENLNQFLMETLLKAQSECVKDSLEDNWEQQLQQQMNLFKLNALIASLKTQTVLVA